MKKFFIKLGMFFLCLAAINIVIYISTFISLLDTYYYKPKSDLLHKHYNSIILGDSHPGTIDQKYWERLNIYNFAKGSDCYHDMLFKIKFLLRERIKPDTIYLTADDHTFSNYRDNLNNLYRSIKYIDYDTYNKVTPIGKVNFLYDKYLAEFFPQMSTKYSIILQEFLLTKLKIKKNDTDYSLNWPNLNEAKIIEESKKRFFFQFDYEKSNNLEKSLKQIVKICNNNNIIIIGIKYPLSKSYLSFVKNNSFNADSTLISMNIKVFDFTKVFLDDKYFKDPDHLNKLGCQKFIDLFEKEVIRKHVN